MIWPFKKKPSKRSVLPDGADILSDDIEALRVARDSAREAAIKSAETHGHLEDLMISALQRTVGND